MQQNRRRRARREEKRRRGKRGRVAIREGECNGEGEREEREGEEGET